MREIKFRAWLKEEERMVNVSDISFIGEEIDIYEGDSSSGDWRPFEDMVLMQYTGLKDDDGIEIYEGDIVECSDSYGNESHVAEVKHRTDIDYPAFDLVPYPDVESNAISYYLADGKIEVVGNIYEDPELLEQK